MAKGLFTFQTPESWKQSGFEEVQRKMSFFAGLRDYDAGNFRHGKRLLSCVEALRQPPDPGRVS